MLSMPQVIKFDPYAALAKLREGPATVATTATVSESVAVVAVVAAGAVVSQENEATHRASDSSPRQVDIDKFDTGTPPAWIVGFHRMLLMLAPSGVDLPRWRLFLGDVAAFLAQRGAEAAGKAWEDHDLFGLSQVAPAARADLAGLCWHMAGREIVMLTTEAASIRTERGSVQRFFRRKRGPGQVLAWELGMEVPS